MKFVALPLNGEPFFVRADTIVRVKTYTNKDGTMKGSGNGDNYKTKVWLNTDGETYWIRTDLWAEDILAMADATIVRAEG